MAKKLTNEDLARMIAHGFAETATNAELKEFREEVEQRFGGVDQRIDGVEKKIDALGNEVREIKIALPPLVRSVEVLEVDVHDLRARVGRLEKKAGLSK